MPDSHSTVAVESTHEHHHPALRHHFDTMDQQRDASGFGMWVFLITEIMFFGGLFAAYLIYRNMYYDAFVAASRTTNVTLGAINTAVLICSSLTMAMAVWSAQMGKRMLLVFFLIATIGLGGIFLGIKAVEYHDKWVDHHVPGPDFSIEEFVHPKAGSGEKPIAADLAGKTPIYFSLYFAMTGMHALHMIIGIGIMTFLVYKAYHGAFSPQHYTMIENFGLYWHFVDIIWIYLFPLLYLISRHK